MLDDPYTILNIYPDCTIEEAKVAYKKAALLHHPDRHPPARKPEAERRFRILAQAFQQVCQDLGYPLDSNDLPNNNHKTSTTKTKDNNSIQNQQKSPSNHNPSSNSTKKISDQASNPSTKALPSSTVSGALTRKASQNTSSRPQPSQPTISDNETKQLQQPVHQNRRSITQPLENTSFESPPSRPSDPSFSNHNNGYDNEYPSDRIHRSQQHPLNRRSSFSHPSSNRMMVNDHGHPPYDPPYRHPQYADRDKLYNLDPPSRRDKDWEFGLGGDDFFSSTPFDRFGPSASSMMNDIGSGFDRMMSSAFKGLSMAGPDPSDLARIEDGNNCSMRMRQSKMVMGRTEDGSWAGKRMEKQMNMSNGRLEVNENAQDIRLGGRSTSGRGGAQYPFGNGKMRSNPQDWDPPPAYYRGGPEDYRNEEGYEPDMNSYRPDHYYPRGRLGPSPHGYPSGGMEPGMPMSGDIIPTHTRHGSLSHSSRGNFPAGDMYYDDVGPPRGPSSRYDYGTELGYPSGSQPMSRHNLAALGPPPSGHSLVRRPPGEISARY